MDATFSYVISSSPDSCDEDEFYLRPHEWLSWERFVISPIGAVLIATATTEKDNDLSDTHGRESLRDELCDLLDALSATGLQLPLTLLVRCSDETYSTWHKLAGDQDWIRGTFCLEPFDGRYSASSGISDIDQFASMLTDDIATHVHTYRLMTISDEQYAETVRERLSEEKSPPVRVLASYLLSALSKAGVMLAGDPVGQTPSGAAVARWIEDEVMLKAIGAVRDQSRAADDAPNSGGVA